MWLANAMTMGGMDMRGFRMEANPFGAVMIPNLRPWSAPEFIFAFVMWAVMMVGMMLPSAAPIILLYALVGRQAAMQGKPLAATGYFATGYLAVWIEFAFIATCVQWTLSRAALPGPSSASTSTVVGGVVLIAAGLFQWTPAKNVCLSYCQSPLVFLQRNGGFRRDAAGSLRIGF
ncbi:MAG TPA: DUF2182 domain-containing protein, partial [Micropepsaceae bacterium]|nr:DUF2182 domain-containing protein [Micropepsaceae bacterium]